MNAVWVIIVNICPPIGPHLLRLSFLLSEMVLTFISI